MTAQRTRSIHGGCGTSPAPVGVWPRPTPSPLPQTEASAGDFAALVARRRQLIEMMIGEKNRLEHAEGRVRTWIEESLAALKSQLAQVEETIAIAVQADAGRRHRFEILTSVGGIGKVTAA